MRKCTVASQLRAVVVSLFVRVECDLYDVALPGSKCAVVVCTRDLFATFSSTLDYYSGINGKYVWMLYGGVRLWKR